MSQISTGPNHSAALSIKRQIFTWGFPQGGRLGLGLMLDDEDPKLITPP